MGYSGRTSRRNRSQPMNYALDRRIACRYLATTKQVILSNMQSGALADHAAELENVSMQGCLVKSRRNPNLLPGEQVWLKIPGDISTPVIDGIVVSVVKPFLGRCAVRIRFLEPVSYLTFKRLVYGEEAIETNRRELPEHENDQFWR